MMYWIVLAFLFGVFSGALASSKNRSFLGWFLLGVFLGPFGLLVAFFPALNKSQFPIVVTPEDEMRSCPFCAEQIKRAALVCRFCSREVPSKEKADFVSAAEYAETKYSASLPPAGSPLAKDGGKNS